MKSYKLMLLRFMHGQQQIKFWVKLVHLMPAYSRPKQFEIKCSIQFGNCHLNHIPPFAVHFWPNLGNQKIFILLITFFKHNWNQIGTECFFHCHIALCRPFRFIYSGLLALNQKINLFLRSLNGMASSPKCWPKWAVAPAKPNNLPFFAYSKHCPRNCTIEGWKLAKIEGPKWNWNWQHTLNKFWQIWFV